MGIGIKVIYNVSKNDTPEWVIHIIDGTETQAFLDNILFIEMDGELNTEIKERFDKINQIN